MINKRLLIKNLLAHFDENSFFDKKRQLNLHTKEGKAKFLKHICALSNSNPNNNSYIVVGVEDTDNEITGTDFYDDSNIQHLVNAFLMNSPKIVYENVRFPHLSSNKVVGLVTIFPNKEVSYFKNKICLIEQYAAFSRIGSNTVPHYEQQLFDNKLVVESIENNSRNDLKQTITDVLDFINVTHVNRHPRYEVFKEYFVLCWAGNVKWIRGKRFLSRVDIFLVNEHLNLFYSELDEVTIEYNENEFVITEYIKLGLKEATSYYPFSKQTITFYDNVTYSINSELIFELPKYNRRLLHHIYNSNLVLIRKLKNNEPFTFSEERDLEHLSHSMMICYLNGFSEAKNDLINCKELLKNSQNPMLFISFKEVMRILRKLKYETIKND